MWLAENVTQTCGTDRISSRTISDQFIKKQSVSYKKSSEISEVNYLVRIFLKTSYFSKSKQKQQQQKNKTGKLCYHLGMTAKGPKLKGSFVMFLKARIHIQFLLFFFLYEEVKNVNVVCL